MECLDRFKKKMNYNGGSLRNENIRNSRQLLKETFYDDASFTPNIYFWESGDFGTDNYSKKDSIDIRLYSRTFSNANGLTIHFQTLHDTEIQVGDILYNLDKDEYMICTEVFDIDSIHWQGKLTMCNWVLRWQDKDGTILEYPCYDINSTQYNSGEQSNRQFTIGSSQHMITLPCDEKTVALSSPQRFFLDKNTENPTSFIVTQNDNTSYNYGKGLVKLTVYEHPSNKDTDRIDLGICDYFEVNNTSTVKGENIVNAVIEYNTDIIKSGGDTKKFVAKFYDNNKNEITSITPVWDIVCDFKSELKVKQSNNEIWISIDNDNYIDEEFKLLLSDDTNTYTTSLVVKIDSLF